MKRPLLNNEIMNFIITSNYVWFRKVKLYPVFEDWSPETIGRALRELESDGYLEVDYYKGKYAAKLARYKQSDKKWKLK